MYLYIITMIIVHICTQHLHKYFSHFFTLMPLVANHFSFSYLCFFFLLSSLTQASSRRRRLVLNAQAGVADLVAQAVARCCLGHCRPSLSLTFPTSLTLSNKWVFGFGQGDDGGQVEWDGGWVVVWLDDGGCVGCLGSVREMRGLNK